MVNLKFSEGTTTRDDGAARLEHGNVVNPPADYTILSLYEHRLYKN